MDSNFKAGKPTPFTDESFNAFHEAWTTKRNGEPDSYGEFRFEADVLTSNADMTDILDISATLEVSYMAFSVCLSLTMLHNFQCTMHHYEFDTMSHWNRRTPT